jgi:hypothetical protein
MERLAVEIKLTIKIVSFTRFKTNDFNRWFYHEHIIGLSIAGDLNRPKPKARNNLTNLKNDSHVHFNHFILLFYCFFYKSEYGSERYIHLAQR